jgi:hypothetical protein
MVLKKLGEELMEEYISVLRFLGEDQGLRILVEPNDFAELVSVSLLVCSAVALKVMKWEITCCNTTHNAGKSGWMCRIQNAVP